MPKMVRVYILKLNEIRYQFEFIKKIFMIYILQLKKNICRFECIKMFRVSDFTIKQNYISVCIYKRVDRV